VGARPHLLACAAEANRKLGLWGNVTFARGVPTAILHTDQRPIIYELIAQGQGKYTSAGPLLNPPGFRPIRFPSDLQARNKPLGVRSVLAVKELGSTTSDGIDQGFKAWERVITYKYAPLTQEMGLLGITHMCLVTF
jgi:hypothetical protein